MTQHVTFKKLNFWYYLVTAAAVSDVVIDQPKSNVTK